jgi:hypothetical protein
MKKPATVSFLLSYHYKMNKHFEKRFLENKTLRTRFPNDIPLIVVVSSPTKDTSIHRLLISMEKDYETMIADVKENLGLMNSSYEAYVERGDKAHYMNVDSSKKNMKEFHKMYKDTDGFLYVVLKHKKKLT